MNVATCGAIKGAVSALDLKEIGCQGAACNTYHLHLRPGDETVKVLGRFACIYEMGRSDLNGYGGFQVFFLQNSTGILKRKASHLLPPYR